MATSQVNRFLFTLFTVYQTLITHDHRRRHPSSIQQFWDAIFSSFYQSMSTKKIWPSCKNLNSDHYDITKFILPSDNHSKYITAKGNFESLSRALSVHLVKYTTISSLKAPKLHVKLVTHMRANWE